jgi:hypothetical protein
MCTHVYIMYSSYIYVHVYVHVSLEILHSFQLSKNTFVHTCTGMCVRISCVYVYARVSLSVCVCEYLHDMYNYEIIVNECVCECGYTCVFVHAPDCNKQDHCGAPHLSFVTSLFLAFPSGFDCNGGI